MMKRTRAYNGPQKGSQEAKDRMAKVRAAQWAKNGLVTSSNTNTPENDRPLPPRRS